MDCKREDAENGSSFLEEQTETLTALLKNLYSATVFSAAFTFFIFVIIVAAYVERHFGFL